MIPNDININFDQLQRFGNLFEPAKLIPAKENTAKVTIDEIKDAFYRKDSTEAFEMLCDVIAKMQKRIEELEGK